jgi:hypothetical protein
MSIEYLPCRTSEKILPRDLAVILGHKKLYRRIDTYYFHRRVRHPFLLGERLANKYFENVAVFKCFGTTESNKKKKFFLGGGGKKKEKKKKLKADEILRMLVAIIHIRVYFFLLCRD